MEIKSDIQKVSIENGKAEVTFREGTVPDGKAFSATYKTSLEEGTPKALTLTQESLNNNVLVLKFDEIKKAPVEQKVDVTLTYKGQNISLDFQVEKSGEEIVNASIRQVIAENGKIAVELDKNPTVIPTEKNFTWKYRVNDGEEKPLEVKDFMYNKENKTATVTFDEMRGNTEKVQKVEVGVSYNEQEVVKGAFEIPITQSNIFYVDSTNGLDTNDGLSPEKPFKTIDKLNTLTFIPGDEIRFKRGETFVGAFQPKGSGTEESPIKIGSYGDGEVKPKLMPGENWTVPYLMSANAMVKNVKVNHVIRFYNQEYWEVSGLEIVDPRGKDYITKGSDVYIGNSKNDVYRSGINIAAEDAGEFEHFYIDDVVIHGFHGPGTNIGKSSGGIIMNVITNEARNREKSIPTRINDIRITNSEIYDVGRSGINFLTPWSYRSDEKWGPFDYGTEVYNNTFYMTERALKDNKLFLFSAVSAYDTMKFYNNIFYYDGEEKVEANTFGDGAIDWESNIFYGFSNAPQNDNEGAPNMSVNPQLKAPGKGETGKVPGEQVDLSCYMLQENSPAIDAGMPVEDNGGRDYFGNEVSGIPDIGAYESGSVSLKLLSKKYEVNQRDKKVILDVNEKVTARDFMENIIVENGIKAEIKRGSATLSGGVRLNNGDQIILQGENQTNIYVVELKEGEKSQIIPVEELTATAGSSETQSSHDVPENVLDGKMGTIWHTSWSGCQPSERYLTLELKNDYNISGYVYTPREGNGGSGAVNGVITEYEIYISDDNETWGEPVAKGSWEANSEVKTVQFENPVKAKYVKLLAVKSVGDFASASEVRLQGTRIYSDKEAPTAPKVSAENVTNTTAELHWLPSEDNEGVVEYQLKKGNDVIATFDADENMYLLADLEPNKEYTYAVYAVDLAGNISAAGEVTFTTKGEKPDEKPTEKPEKKPGTSVSDKNKTPKTGDATDVLPWILCMASAGLAGGILINKKKQGK